MSENKIVTVKFEVPESDISDQNMQRDWSARRPGRVSADLGGQARR